MPVKVKNRKKPKGKMKRDAIAVNGAFRAEGSVSRADPEDDVIEEKGGDESSEDGEEKKTPDQRIDRGR